MEWIRRHKRTLQVLTALSALTAAVLVAAYQGRPTTAAPWQIGLVVLPVAVGVATFFPLIYVSWFGKPRARFVRALGLGFFWLLVAVWAAIFAQIYGTFVFGLWQ